MHGGSLAESTRIETLRHVDAFYLFCEKRLAPYTLDRVIGESNATKILDLIQAFYYEMGLRAQKSAYAAKRFDAVAKFITDIGTMRGHTSPVWREITRGCKNFEPLKSRKRGKVKFIRALPSATLADLLAVMNPEGDRNPATKNSIRYRNWLITNLLLLLGLRRGECLVLPVDALKSQVDVRTGEIRWWLDVTEHRNDVDPRFTRPSIKTAQSRRQLPVSPSLAQLITAYIENWRGSPEHEFLLTSREGKPLSSESVNSIFRNASLRLSTSATKEFRDRTGGKESVSPHDLRHTCAVVRLKQFLAQELSHDETMQRLRSFFGWSYKSIMPLHYAKAAFEERLAQVWGNAFDQHTNILRNLPQ